MTLFLTSHIGGSVRKDGQRIPSSLITDNNLVNNLKTRWPEQAKVMFIAANPNNIEKSESYRNAFLYTFWKFTYNAMGPIVLTFFKSMVQCT